MAKKQRKVDVVTLTEKQQQKRAVRVNEITRKIFKQLDRMVKLGMNERELNAIRARVVKLKF